MLLSPNGPTGVVPGAAQGGVKDTRLVVFDFWVLSSKIRTRIGYRIILKRFSFPIEVGPSFNQTVGLGNLSIVPPATPKNEKVFGLGGGEEACASQKMNRKLLGSHIIPTVEERDLSARRLLFCEWWEY